MSKHQLLSRVALAVTLLWATPVKAVSIVMNSPVDNQNFSAGVPISYGGGGSWILSPAEPQTIYVFVELLWFDPNNVSGLGTLTSSDLAVITYNYDSRGSMT